jgi:general secretion pathway protein I
MLDCKQRANGFSLIEVLIALVILSLSLTALIQSSSQNIRNTEKLNNNIIANWVALHAVDMIQIGLLKIPSSGRPLYQKTKMLGKDWYWSAVVRNTKIKAVKQLIINVKLKQAGPNVKQVKAYYYAGHGQS